MYKRTETICCDVCQTELEYLPSDCYSSFSLDYQCKKSGWVVNRHLDHVEHICPKCIRIVGYTHSFGLAEAALKRFDPQTYGNAKLAWCANETYLSHSELVKLTHPRGDKQ